MVKILRETDQLDNTYIVFMGDNGYILGQHAISYGKYFPYEPALNIPAMMRGPGIKPKTVVEGMTFEIDLAPTILELAGVKANRPIDGLSLVDRVMNNERLPRRPLLLSSGPQQSASGSALPLFDGVRTERYVWWVYEDGFEEMYDLQTDPYQMESVAKDPAYLKTKLALIGLWDRLQNCKGAACRVATPPVPGPTSTG
jgi:arylsulfatase A-like enzyme